MQKRRRAINDCIKILVYVWFKWMHNHERANNASLSFSQRRFAGLRCEQLQFIRQRVIKEINYIFEEK